VAVLDPVRLVLDNYPADATEDCTVPNHPQKPERGTRTMPFTRELWIEREDFTETPAKGYFRLFPGNRVRLRYAYVIECTGCDKDAEGRVVAVHARYLPDTRSGTPGADSVKVKGNIHWISAIRGIPAEVRLYDRLFLVPQPGAEGDYIADLNPASRRIIGTYVEPAAGSATAGDRFQFERHGYFIADAFDSRPDALVFNRTVTLRDSWGRQEKK
jgi:glutaminyl-tRNA synthetase